MNKLERVVYNLLRSNPSLKKGVRNIYQRCFDLLPQARATFAYPITVRPGFFFGFHDLVPFSTDNKRLLANRFDIPLRMPELGEPLEVGYFDGPDHLEFHPVSSTRAWTWHMGCRLQWRGAGSDIVFNDHADGFNIARIVNVDTGAVHDLPDSIGSVSPDGRWAVGYSFARVARCMPGYGYHYDIGDSEITAHAPLHNGIHIIDLETGQRKLLLSLAELAEMQPEASMKGATHFATHTVFSPDSRRFIFLHRWIMGDNVAKRWSRLVSCDLEARSVCIFPTVDMVSHIGWRDSNHVIAYCRIPRYDDQYVLFRDGAPEFSEVVGEGQFSSDGHPSFEPDGRWMVTDTYPDRRRVQTLILYDTELRVRYDIARLPMPVRYQSPSEHQHWACDLHPRWDRSGSRICFDSTYNGSRSLCTIDLDTDLNQNAIRYVTRS